MTYFPNYRIESKPQKCPGCGGWFIYNEHGMSCLVLHAPGTCCHYGETQVSAPAGVTAEGARLSDDPA